MSVAFAISHTVYVLLMNVSLCQCAMLALCQHTFFTQSLGFNILHLVCKHVHESTAMSFIPLSKMYHHEPSSWDALNAMF